MTPREASPLQEVPDAPRAVRTRRRVDLSSEKTLESLKRKLVEVLGEDQDDGDEEEARAVEQPAQKLPCQPPNSPIEPPSSQASTSSGNEPPNQPPQPPQQPSQPPQQPNQPSTSGRGKRKFTFRLSESKTLTVNLFMGRVYFHIKDSVRVRTLTLSMYEMRQLEGLIQDQRLEEAIDYVAAEEAEERD